MASPQRTAILLISCPDQPGLVAAVAEFVQAHSGNIVYLAQHVDSEHGVFFMRIEWELEGFGLNDSDLSDLFQADVAAPLQMTWSLYYSDQRPRVAIFATKEGHCLYDLLSRHEAGELDIDIPLIIGNREDLRGAAERFDIPFHHFPITKANKAEQEAKELALLEDHQIDTVVLARYMQILSDNFVSHYPNSAINIHHSFLPAFAGARPYHQAFERGVKIIGATSHYVTADLDEGPIIAQDVATVSHRDTADHMVTLGRDIERTVLSRAVKAAAEDRIFLLDNARTVVFE